ncbi:MAG: response regulator [Cyanobacteria bacterium P01_F01_bin.150]
MQTILVVDDVKSEQELISAYLMNAGYQVITADNGSEAIAMIKRKKPDLIVTDLVMPEVTGLELCRLLKKTPSTAEIPIIACTTKDRKMDKTWAKRQGVAAYVVKPFQESQLLTAVRSVQS